VNKTNATVVSPTTEDVLQQKELESCGTEVYHKPMAICCD